MWVYTARGREGSRRLVELETNTVLLASPRTPNGKQAVIMRLQGNNPDGCPALAEYETDQEAAAALEVLAARLQAVDMAALLGPSETSDDGDAQPSRGRAFTYEDK